MNGYALKAVGPQVIFGEATKASAGSIERRWTEFGPHMVFVGVRPANRLLAAQSIKVSAHPHASIEPEPLI